MAQHNGSGRLGGAGRRGGGWRLQRWRWWPQRWCWPGRGRRWPSQTGRCWPSPPSPYDYGQVTTGETVSQRFRLTNSGGKATGKLKVTLSGAAAFTIGRDRCSGTRLRPGRSCGVRVRFAPTSAATVTATLTAASNKGRVSATVALSGSGRSLGAAPGQIYWVSQDEIWAANLDGSNPHVIVTGQLDLEGIAANSSHLYWTNGADGTIWEANLDGSSPHTIVTGLGAQAVAGVAVTASHIYWANEGDASDGAGTIWAANLDGSSSPHTIVTGQFRPAGVAVDATHLYWTSTDGQIWRADLDGSDSQAIVTGQTSPSWMAITPP